MQTKRDARYRHERSMHHLLGIFVRHTAFFTVVVSVTIATAATATAVIALLARFSILGCFRRLCQLRHALPVRTIHGVRKLALASDATLARCCSIRLALRAYLHGNLRVGVCRSGHVRRGLCFDLCVRCSCCIFVFIDFVVVDKVCHGARGAIVVHVFIIFRRALCSVVHILAHRTRALPREGCAKC